MTDCSLPDITCPFCGLLCDDLRVAEGAGPLAFTAGACARATRLFQVPAAGQARIGGRPVDAAQACAEAARLLAAARRPLVGGLACDVSGQRAAIAFAERLGGVLEHMNGRVQFRNFLALQDGGWMTTTLSEVRNRADVIVLAGTDTSRFPRFFERLLAGESQFGEPRRQVIALSSSPQTPLAGQGADLAISCEPGRLGELFAALRARLAGRAPAADPVAGVSASRLDALLETLRAARYGVLVWNAAELDFPHADLTVQAMVDLVKDLNRDTRWSGLPLGGNDGDTCAAQVCTWQAGYPLRTAFTADGPHYDPIRFDGERLLARGEVDALVWIAAFDPGRAPPETGLPTIVLGRADMEFPRHPEVFIPVAVPGVQQAGFLHRMDGVVALPLAAPSPAQLPGVAEVLNTIRKELDHAAA